MLFDVPKRTCFFVRIVTTTNSLSATGGSNPLGASCSNPLRPRQRIDLTAKETKHALHLFLDALNNYDSNVSVIFIFGCSMYEINEDEDILLLAGSKRPLDANYAVVGTDEKGTIRTDVRHEVL